VLTENPNSIPGGLLAVRSGAFEVRSRGETEFKIKFKTKFKIKFKIKLKTKCGGRFENAFGMARSEPLRSVPSRPNGSCPK
jgi:hypothetical protein